MIYISRLRIISTCSSRQNGDKDLICVENIQSSLLTTSRTLPLFCFCILGPKEEVENVICRGANLLNYCHSFGLIEPSQLEEVWLLVKFVEHGT